MEKREFQSLKSCEIVRHLFHVQKKWKSSFFNDCVAKLKTVQKRVNKASELFTAAATGAASSAFDVPLRVSTDTCHVNKLQNGGWEREKELEEEINFLSLCLFGAPVFLQGKSVYPQRTVQRQKRKGLIAVRKEATRKITCYDLVFFLTT